MLPIDYRNIPRISNSDLTAFKNKLFGIDFKIPEKAFAFGSAFHQLVLEPQVSHALPQEIDIALLQRLAGKVRQHRMCKWYMQFSRKENIQFFTDPDTGLECKSKLDIVYKDKTIIDFKTTSARDYRSFIATAQSYDYDRQAAFYVDSLSRDVKAKKFIFIGIQKIKPYDLFYFEPDAPFIDMGRKKYKALLRKWKEINISERMYA